MMLCAKSSWNRPIGCSEEENKPIGCSEEENRPIGCSEEFFFLILRMYFRYYRSLKKGVFLHLNRLEFHLLKDSLCHVWLKLAQWFWRRKCEKFTDRQTDTQSDGRTDRRQTTRKAYLSFQLRWANSAFHYVTNISLPIANVQMFINFAIMHGRALLAHWWYMIRVGAKKTCTEKNLFTI